MLSVTTDAAKTDGTLELTTTPEVEVGKLPGLTRGGTMEAEVGQHLVLRLRGGAESSSDEAEALPAEPAAAPAAPVQMPIDPLDAGVVGVESPACLTGV